MKYRDLVLVLVLVAVGVLCYSGPQTEASESRQEPARVALSAEATAADLLTAEATPAEALPSEAAPTDALSAQATPAATPSRLVVETPGHKSPRRMDAVDIPRPTLALSLEHRTETLEDMIVSAKLETTEPASIYIDPESGEPLLRLTASVDDRYWEFRSKDPTHLDAATRKVKELSWEVKLADLVKPGQIDELRSLYKSAELSWVMTLVEAEEETSPMTRRVIMPIMGGFSTKP